MRYSGLRFLERSLKLPTDDVCLELEEMVGCNLEGRRACVSGGNIIDREIYVAVSFKEAVGKYWSFWKMEGLVKCNYWISMGYYETVL